MTQGVQGVLGEPVGRTGEWVLAGRQMQQKSKTAEKGLIYPN